MNLQQSLEALYGLERRRDKLGLDGTRALLGALGHPERRFRAVHVAGTNGKGSTCALVERDPATNVITRVSNILVNIDDAKVAGTDFELTYATATDWFESQNENLSFRFLAGVLAENSSTPLGGQPLDLAGSTQFPELTTTATVNYRVGPWTAYVQHRYIEGTKVNASWTEGVDVDRLWIDSVDYTNLGLTYTRDGANGTWEFFGNVVNAFDEHPPPIPTDVGRGIAGSTGYVQHNAIALGRRFVIGARLRL